MAHASECSRALGRESLAESYEADAAWDDGFMAIGSLSVPAGANKVAAVTVKGKAYQLRSYPAAFRRAANLGDKLLGELLGNGQ